MSLSPTPNYSADFEKTLRTKDYVAYLTVKKQFIESVHNGFEPKDVEWKTALNAAKVFRDIHFTQFIYTNHHHHEHSTCQGGCKHEHNHE